MVEPDFFLPEVWSLSEDIRAIETSPNVPKLVLDSAGIHIISDTSDLTDVATFEWKDVNGDIYAQLMAFGLEDLLGQVILRMKALQGFARIDAGDAGTSLARLEVERNLFQGGSTFHRVKAAVQHGGSGFTEKVLLGMNDGILESHFPLLYAPENVLEIFGTVAANGAKNSGSDGWTSVRTAVGTYRIDYDLSGMFVGNAPSVTVTPIASSPHTPRTGNYLAGSFIVVTTVNTTGAAADVAFAFDCIGLRN